MSGISDQNLIGVTETLLLPLYIRALESQRPDAIIKDEKAVALIQNLAYDSSWMDQMKVGEDDKAFIILRNQEFDRCVRNFLDRHPQAVVVHIGCGLDSRFERVDNCQVEWYDLDLPEVIELRRKLIRGEGDRYHHLSCSALDNDWMDTVSMLQPSPTLFLAEGVFMYFEEAEAKELVLSLQEHFPGAELVFDAVSPYIVWTSNLRFARTKIGARYHFGLKHGKDLEKWADGVRLLDEWFLLDHFEPRLAKFQWMRRFPFLAKAAGIYHYRLEKPTITIM